MTFINGAPMNLKSKVLSTNIYIYRTGAKLGTTAIYFIQIVTWYQCHTIDTSGIMHAQCKTLGVKSKASLSAHPTHHRLQIIPELLPKTKRWDATGRQNVGGQKPKDLPCFIFHGFDSDLLCVTRQALSYTCWNDKLIFLFASKWKINFLLQQCNAIIS